MKTDIYKHCSWWQMYLFETELFRKKSETIMTNKCRLSFFYIVLINKVNRCRADLSMQKRWFSYQFIVKKKNQLLPYFVDLYQKTAFSENVLSF